jgi:heme/copper-type cytochrome/quinol oxidase subunit 2
MIFIFIQRRRKMLIQRSHVRKFSFTTLFVLILTVTVRGEDSAPEIRFENQHFTPQTLTVPAGQPLSLKVTNASADPIEFESFALHREKVVEPGQTITVHLPALSPGTYDFYDDFHQEAPEGSIVVQ